MRLKTIEIAFAILFMALFISCSAEKTATRDSSVSTDKTSQTKGADNVASPNPNDVGRCDPGLWKHVYDPSRLEVVEQCREATGVIEELDRNEDGDTHMLLKLDPGQEGLLNKKNLKKKNGDLVIEVVCANAVTDKKAKNACVGYSNQVQLPNVGDSVKVTGSYVIDSHNGWSEIHPVSRIESRGPH